MASNKLKINDEETEDKFVPVFDEEQPKEPEKKEAPKAKNQLRKFAKFKGM